jgi:hypothetical protein
LEAEEAALRSYVFAHTDDRIGAEYVAVVGHTIPLPCRPRGATSGEEAVRRHSRIHPVWMVRLKERVRRKDAV